MIYYILKYLTNFNIYNTINIIFNRDKCMIKCMIVLLVPKIFYFTNQKKEKDNSMLLYFFSVLLILWIIAKLIQMMFN